MNQQPHGPTTALYETPLKSKMKSNEKFGHIRAEGLTTPAKGVRDFLTYLGIF